MKGVIRVSNLVTLARLTDVNDLVMYRELLPLLDTLKASRGKVSKREEFEDLMLKASLASIYEGCLARLHNFTVEFRAINAHKLERMSAVLMMVKDIAYHPMYPELFPEKGYPEMSVIVDEFLDSTLGKAGELFKKQAAELKCEDGAEDTYMEAERLTLIINSITSQLMNIKDKYQPIVYKAVEIDIFPAAL